MSVEVDVDAGSPKAASGEYFALRGGRGPSKELPRLGEIFRVVELGRAPISSGCDG